MTHDQDILTQIYNGDFDDRLDLLGAAVKARRSLLRASGNIIAIAALDIGDAVRLKNISPKYMVGKTAVIVGKGRSRFQVRVDNPPTNGKFGGIVTVPATSVERVS